MKVRLLYFAHLYNIPLSPELEEDLAVILQKIPLLHGELISKTFIMERILLGLFVLTDEFMSGSIFSIFRMVIKSGKDPSHASRRSFSTNSKG